MNLVKYGVFLAQLSLLPLFIAINPAVADSINNSQMTKTNSIRDISSRHEVSISAKDLLARPRQFLQRAELASQRTHMRASPLSQSNLTFRNWSKGQSNG